MTMSKGLFSYIEGRVSELKVMCGVSLDSPACEERAIKAVKSEPIPALKFMNIYRQRKRSGQLAVEFKALHRNQDEHSTTAALRNVLLNNKQDVLSYDHSRVIILNPNEANDYYNASYIDGYNVPREYIASQGPSTKNISAFWYMIWQESITCIVMATGLFENAMQQCDKYWVDHASNVAVHGTIKVWHEQSTCLAQLNIRTFRLQKEGCCETRVLHQFEMVGLHEECPDSGLLLDVRRRVHALTHHQPGSVLVHCRCGGGRTAVYVALDYCLYQLQAEERVDVYSAVLQLRRFRKNMVKTVSQYQQIYHAVAMYIQCGVTVYPSETLPSAFQLHYGCGREGKSVKLDREFQTLQSIVPRLSIGDCASGHRVENRSKSRDIMMLPPECARPYLNTADCGDSGTDFINAVYVDGYHTLNRYLVTQWPMKRTTADVWRLLFDFKITSLVLMNDMKKFTRSYPRFWPKEIDQVTCYGPISVRYISCERRPDLVIRTFAIRKILNNLIGCELRRDEIIVKMFQVLGKNPTGKRSAHTTNTDISITDTNSSFTSDSGRVRSRCRLQNGRRHRRRRDSSSRCRTPDLADSVEGMSDSNDVPRGKKCKLKNGLPAFQSKSLLAVMEHVEEWGQRCLSRQPVCVISKNGSSDAGLFCTISICCDQLKAEKEVDVFNAVRYVRCNRPQLIPTQEEYRFIYQFMTELIKLTKSKPDIIVSKPFPTFFTPSNTDKAPFVTTSSVNNCIHGGVYVTKLEDKLEPVDVNEIENVNNAQDTVVDNNFSENHPSEKCVKKVVGKANSYPLNALSSTQVSSMLYEKASFKTKLNIVGDPMSSSSKNCPTSFNASTFGNQLTSTIQIHAPSSNTGDLLVENNSVHLEKHSEMNKNHNFPNAYLSPNFCPVNGRDSCLNSNSSLCRSASFYSCDSNLSDKYEEDNYHHTKGYKTSSNHLSSVDELCSETQSYSTLKDFPTEDTSIKSFQLGCEHSPSNNTSCPSILDSCNDINNSSTHFINEKNNNCHKTESDKMFSDKLKSNAKVKKSQKKSRVDKWSFSLPKVLGWKRK